MAVETRLQSLTGRGSGDCWTMSPTSVWTPPSAALTRSASMCRYDSGVGGAINPAHIRARSAATPRCILAVSAWAFAACRFSRMKPAPYVRSASY